MKLSKRVRTSLDTVIQKFKAGDLSAITQVARIRLAADAPASRWSFANRVIALVQTGELDCRGYRQWQEIGRQVKKGSQAAYILRPWMVKKTREVDGEMEEYFLCLGFSPIPVFPASATEGETPLLEYMPIQLPPLSEVANRLGILVNYVPVASDRLGDCDVTGQKIRLGSTDPAVFFHELAHAIHARLDGRLQGGQHVTQEIVAEFTATVLMELYGLRDHTGNAWRYIELYAKDPLQAITKALGTVEQVLAVLTTANAETDPTGDTNRIDFTPSGGNQDRRRSNGT